MILVAKIFYMCNTAKILPMLVEPGAMKNWIDIFVAILDQQPDASSPLVQKTDNLEQIEALDKEEWWKLKAICTKISLKLYNK